MDNISKDKHMEDLNKDGKVDDVEMQLHRERVSSQRKMAYAALGGILASGAYIIGFADGDQIRAIGEALDFFWITLAGVVATHMGSEAWATKRKQ